MYELKHTYVNGIISRASHSLSAVVLEDEGFVRILALGIEGGVSYDRPVC